MDKLDLISKEDLLKILNTFGIHNQQRKFQEEVFELQEAITMYESNRHCECGRKGANVDEITEELSDVFVLLNQIIAYYDLSVEEINKIAKAKTTRTLERIKTNYYNKKD